MKHPKWVKKSSYWWAWEKCFVLAALLMRNHERKNLDSFLSKQEPITMEFHIYIWWSNSIWIHHGFNSNTLHEAVSTEYRGWMGLFTPTLNFYGSRMEARINAMHSCRLLNDTGHNGSRKMKKLKKKKEQRLIIKLKFFVLFPQFLNAATTRRRWVLFLQEYDYVIVKWM